MTEPGPITRLLAGIGLLVLVIYAANWLGWI